MENHPELVVHSPTSILNTIGKFTGEEAKTIAEKMRDISSLSNEEISKEIFKFLEEVGTYPQISSGNVTGKNISWRNVDQLLRWEQVLNGSEFFSFSIEERDRLKNNTIMKNKKGGKFPFLPFSASLERFY